MSNDAADLDDVRAAIWDFCSLNHSHPQSGEKCWIMDDLTAALAAEYQRGRQAGLEAAARHIEDESGFTALARRVRTLTDQPDPEPTPDDDVSPI